MLDMRIYVLLNGNVKVDFDDIVAMHYNNVLGTGTKCSSPNWLLFYWGE